MLIIRNQVSTNIMHTFQPSRQDWICKSTKNKHMKTVFATLTLLIVNLNGFGQETIKTTKVKVAYHTYYSDIIIDASPAQVWSVLTDFKSYPQWSYLFKKLEGDFKNQGSCTAYFDRKPEKNSKQIILDHIITVKPFEYFSWSDKFGFGIKDHHLFKVEAIGNGKTRFIQSDESKGGLTWLIGKIIDTYREDYYPLYNRALKAEVERRFKS